PAADSTTVIPAPQVVEPEAGHGSDQLDEPPALAVLPRAEVGGEGLDPLVWQRSFAQRGPKTVLCSVVGITTDDDGQDSPGAGEGFEHPNLFGHPARAGG